MSTSCSSPHPPSARRGGGLARSQNDVCILHPSCLRPRRTLMVRDERTSPQQLTGSRRSVRLEFSRTRGPGPPTLLRWGGRARGDAHAARPASLCGDVQDSLEFQVCLSIRFALVNEQEYNVEFGNILGQNHKSGVGQRARAARFGAGAQYWRLKRNYCTPTWEISCSPPLLLSAEGMNVKHSADPSTVCRNS